MILDKRIEICLLLDFYGVMLTQKQQNIMHKYYEEDISLAEIGQQESISRQAVRDTLVVSEKILRDFEAKLGFVSKRKAMEAGLDEIINNIDNLQNTDIINKIKSLYDNLY